MHRVGSEDWKIAFAALKSAAKDMTADDRLSLRRRGAHQLKSRALVQVRVLEAEGHDEDAERLAAFADEIDVESGDIPTPIVSRRAPLMNTLFVSATG